MIIEEELKSYTDKQLFDLHGEIFSCINSPKYNTVLDFPLLCAIMKKYNKDCYSRADLQSVVFAVYYEVGNRR